MVDEFEKLKQDICDCRFCKDLFGFEPNPIFWGNKNSKIVQISQAPSLTVNNECKPFTDKSGDTLKYEWYQINDEEFYNKNNFYIAALSHCYPGKDKNGNDKYPPKCCYEKWISKELKLINNEIYIIIGALACKRFFHDEKFEDLVFKNNYFNNKLTIVLPHPSPLNRKWIKDHPKFLSERILEVRKIIINIIGDKNE